MDFCREISLYNYNLATQQFRVCTRHDTARHTIILRLDLSLTRIGEEKKKLYLYVDVCGAIAMLSHHNAVYICIDEISGSRRVWVAAAESMERFRFNFNGKSPPAKSFDFIIWRSEKKKKLIEWNCTFRICCVCVCASEFAEHTLTFRCS